MKMQFARHETFYLREGWLTKGLREIAIADRPDIFLRKDAIEHLGIGSNMVKALRFWMQATGITTEKKVSGKTIQELTSFGKLIKDYDRYLEEEISLWLLHYHLTTNSEQATTWYWFFNIFEHKEFDEEIFVNMLDSWIRQQGEKVAKGSLKRDFDCLLNTYLFNKDSSNRNPEDNLGCPLRELGLIEALDEKKRRYRMTRRQVAVLPNELFFYCILLQANDAESNYLSIDELLDQPGSIGRVFALGLAEVIQVLESLEHSGFLYVTKTDGLNNVSITKENIDPTEVLTKYYEQYLRGVDKWVS